MSVRHPIKDGPTCLSVLTVTPIDRLHDGDGSNGVKGAAEEGKLCKLWNKAQQAQWTCWQAQNVHIHMPNEARAHPLAWAPSPDEGPDLPITFQETCSASKRGLSSKPQRLVQQVWVTSSASLWGLLYKERRQDLTTIKRPQHPQKKVCIINPSSTLEL